MSEKLVVRLTAILVVLGLGCAEAFATTDRVFRQDFEASIAITAPDETWTWTDVPGARCGDGSATGIGVNLTTLSDKILIYLEGGGACWSKQTCYTLQTAANFSGGYSETQFASEIASFGTLDIFDRTSSSNPFKDYSYVFVPYCTGDDHAGDNVVQYDASHVGYHVGFRNMTLDLERLSDTFPLASYVMLSGSSSGGFGALLNWWQTQEAFPTTRVDMIDDSGATMPEDVLPSPNSEEIAQRTNWNLATTLPPGCTTCATNFDGLFDFYAEAFPDSRGTLLTYHNDTVLPTFYGITSSQFMQGLSELEANRIVPHTNLRYFDDAAAGHVIIFNTTVTVNSIGILQFLTKMVTDDSTWNNEPPPN